VEKRSLKTVIDSLFNTLQLPTQPNELIPHRSFDGKIAQKLLKTARFGAKTSHISNSSVSKIERIFIFGRTYIETIYLRKENMALNPF